jgi:hypothetical protein
MKFRAKLEKNEYNNLFIIIQVKRLFFWKDLYYNLTNGIDGAMFWPIIFSCTAPYHPQANDLLVRLEMDKKVRKNYYVRTIFGYRRLK